MKIKYSNEIQIKNNVVKLCTYSTQILPAVPYTYEFQNQFPRQHLWIKLTTKLIKFNFKTRSTTHEKDSKKVEHFSLSFVASGMSPTAAVPALRTVSLLPLLDIIYNHEDVDILLDFLDDEIWILYYVITLYYCFVNYLRILI